MKHTAEIHDHHAFLAISCLVMFDGGRMTVLLILEYEVTQGELGRLVVHDSVGQQLMK